MPPPTTSAIEREARQQMELQRLKSAIEGLDRRLEAYDRGDRPSVSEIERFGTYRARSDEAIDRRLDLERRGLAAERRAAEDALDREVFQERVLGTGARRP